MQGFLIIALVFTVDGETYTAVIGELILPQLSSPTFIAKSSVSHQTPLPTSLYRKLSLISAMAIYFKEQ